MKKALYFEILNYKKDNLDILCDNFEVIRLNNPSMITPDILKDVSVIFTLLGYFFGEDIFFHGERQWGQGGRGKVKWHVLLFLLLQYISKNIILVMQYILYPVRKYDKWKRIN